MTYNEGVDIQPEGSVFQKERFFYPTSPHVYKNNGAVIAASEKLALRGLTHTVVLTLPPQTSCGNVQCVGRISYKQVLQHYATSTLLFPSYIETFGYPLAEARSVGTIVLAADTPFAREVLDGYENAYFFDPFKSDELAKLMEKMISGSIKRKPTTALKDDHDSWLDVMTQVLTMGE